MTNGSDGYLPFKFWVHVTTGAALAASDTRFAAPPETTKEPQ